MQLADKVVVITGAGNGIGEACAHRFTAEGTRVALLSTHVEKAAYAVTKHGGLALGEWLALHERPHGIKVSCFCPGPMRTRMLLGNDLPADSPVLADAVTPEQVAAVLVAGIAAERFLILTPAGSTDALAARAADYDAWLGSLETSVS